MESRRRRYLNFDLDSAALRAALGGENGRKRAYGLVKSYMLNNGFEHRQGSAYMSYGTLSDAEIYDLADGLVRQHSWMAQCTKGYDVTNVGATHDYLFVFRQYKDGTATSSDDDLLAL